MQFLDTAEVKLEVKIATHQAVAPSLARGSYTGTVTLLNPGFVLPSDALALQRGDCPWAVSANPRGSQKWTQNKPLRTCKLQV